MEDADIVLLSDTLAAKKPFLVERAEALGLPLYTTSKNSLAAIKDLLRRIHSMSVDKDKYASWVHLMREAVVSSTSRELPYCDCLRAADATQAGRTTRAVQRERRHRAIQARCRVLSDDEADTGSVWSGVMKHAFFLTFEGIDGCGKSTQAERLKRALTERHFPSHTRSSQEERRSDGSSERSSSCRMSSTCPCSPRCCCSRPIADRTSMRSSILHWNVATSSSANGLQTHQSRIRGSRETSVKERVERLMDIVTSGLIPDLTLLLDIDPRISLARKTDLDRIEQRGSFLDVVRHAFLDMAASQPDRWVVIDAARPADDVFSDVLEAVLKRLKLAEA